MALAITAVIALVGAFIRSISGFGYAMVATPLMALVIDVKSVVVINMMLSTTMNVVMVFYMRRHIDPRRTAFICLGSVPGIPVGVYLLSVLDPMVIKLAIAMLVIPFSILLLLGHSHRFQHDTIGCTISGFISGVLLGSTSLGGPPVVLFLLNQGMTKEKFVGTLAVFFLFSCLVTLATFTSFNLINTEILTKAVMLLPPLWLGSYAGIKVLPRINPVLFRKLASSLISLVALIIIVTFLFEL